jgi:ribosomal-protein-alanine N-acetyltransferase
LILRPLTAADAAAVHSLWVSPGVRRYLWDDEVIPLEQAAAAVEESLALFESSGCGLWGVRLNGDDELAGFCGYWHFHEPPELELLYGVSETQWRKGLATEMAEAMIRYGFDGLGFERIQASTDAANLASIRVMEKAGMRFLKREITGGLDTVYYVVNRNS